MHLSKFIFYMHWLKILFHLTQEIINIPGISIAIIYFGPNGTLVTFTEVLVAFVSTGAQGTTVAMACWQVTRPLLIWSIRVAWVLIPERIWANWVFTTSISVDKTDWISSTQLWSWFMSPSSSSAPYSNLSSLSNNSTTITSVWVRHPSRSLLHPSTFSVSQDHLPREPKMGHAPTRGGL